MTSARLLIGGPVWGTYVDVFERYCLATMRAPANLAALRENGATLEVYTDEPSHDRMVDILAGCGIDYEVKRIGWSGTKYEVLALCHAQQVRECADAGRPFHMLVADQMYSANYWPNAFRLAAKYGNIIHSGVNCTMSGAGAELDKLRAADGSISVSSKDLGKITWKHRHNRLAQFLMNDGEWPDFHMHIWRARDRAMIFCPHNSPVFLSPDAGKRLGATRSTLDAMAHTLGDYHAPTLDDDMTLSGIEMDDGIGTCPRVTWHQFATRCWEQAKGVASLARYYRRPSAEVAIGIDLRAPSARRVMAKQAGIAERLLDYVVEAGWASPEERAAVNG